MCRRPSAQGDTAIIDLKFSAKGSDLPLPGLSDKKARIDSDEDPLNLSQVSHDLAGRTYMARFKPSGLHSQSLRSQSFLHKEKACCMVCVWLVSAAFDRCQGGRYTHLHSDASL